MKKVFIFFCGLCAASGFALGPGIVTGVEIVDTDNNKVALQWKPSENAEKYIIYYDEKRNIDEENPQYIEQREHNSLLTTTVIDNLKANTEYSFVIVGVDSDRRESEELSKPISGSTSATNGLVILNTDASETEVILTFNKQPSPDTDILITKNGIQIPGDFTLGKTGTTTIFTPKASLAPGSYDISGTLADVFGNTTNLKETSFTIVGENASESPLGDSNKVETEAHTEPVKINELPRAGLTEVFIIIFAIVLGLIIERSVSRRFLADHPEMDG